MAASKERIDYNYQEMLELVAELNGILEELEAVKQTFDSTMTNLGTYWKGKSSDDYRAQGSGVSGFMQENINSVRAVSEGIKKTAELYREAEYQNLEQTE